MVYTNIQFPILKKRPFFYTNFVSTVDGKVQVLTNDQSRYWPIGSPADYATLIQLRSFADVLIYGKNSAASFNHGNNLAKKEFKEARIKNGKDANILYFIICNTTNGLSVENIQSPHSKYTYIVVPKNTHVERELEQAAHILRIGEKTVKIPLLVDWLHKKGYQHVLVEGGPTLLGSFLKENFIDEIFLTIAPKIFGNEKEKTLTLIEGYLFPPNLIPQLTLLSVKKLKNELFLHYQISHNNQS